VDHKAEFVAHLNTTIMKTGKAILAVAAGIAAGAVLGVLFAPEKGVDTRKRIVKKGKDLVDELDDKIEAKFKDMMRTISGKFIRIKNDKEPHKAEMAEV
jgi:gas vesicle protein